MEENLVIIYIICKIRTGNELSKIFENVTRQFFAVMACNLWKDEIHFQAGFFVLYAKQISRNTPLKI